MSRTGWTAYLFLIIIIGAGFRFGAIDRMSIWGDEACMIYLCRTDPGDIIKALVSENRPDVDVAPPLYFLILHRWMKLFGDSVTSFRGLSAVFGILNILAGAWLAAILFDRRTGLILGLLTTFSPLQVWYSQEGRMYSMAACLATSTLLLFVLAAGNDRNRWLWFLFCLSGCALIYTQYYGILLMGAIFGLAFMDALKRPVSRQRLFNVLAAALICAAAFLPWLPVVFKDYAHAGVPGGFPSYFHPVRSPAFLLAKLTVFGNQNYILDHPWLYAAGIPLFAFAGLSGLRFFREYGIRLGLTCFLIPFGIIYIGAVAGLRIYKSHPFILFQVPLFLVIAFGIRRLAPILRSILIVMIIALNTYVLMTLNLGGEYVKPRTEEAIGWIAERVREGDRVAVMPAFLPSPMPTVGDLLAFRYYAEDRFQVLYLHGDSIREILPRLHPSTLKASRLFVVYQDNLHLQSHIEKFRDWMSKDYRIVEEHALPSGIRDFSMGVILYGTRGEQDHDRISRPTAGIHRDHGKHPV
ncbi:glycosyltransferase family 39 protein [bacterium]|nr:glycosyltransferase family 39 protein [candidate division CSSED10-310 bacterium]